MTRARVRVDDPHGIGPCHARALPLQRGPQGTPRQAIIVRDVQGTLHAYLNVCMHMPIPLDAGGGDFLSPERTHLLCRTHGATYRLEDGLCVRGPCQGRSLVRLDLAWHNGEPYVVDLF